MEAQRTASLVVLTLLQLCRAQQIPTQWYSAKVNDDFQPKPISEIFTTEPTFSTAKPIVVTQKISNGVSDDYDYSSTLAPPTSNFESTRLTQQTFPSTKTPLPAGALYQQYHLEQLNPIQVDISPPQPGYPQQFVPFVQSDQLDIQHLPIEPTQKAVDETLTSGRTSTSPTSAPTMTNPPRPFAPPNSNYFLIYQQAQQPVPAFPPSPATVTFPPSTLKDFSTTQALPISSISTSPATVSFPPSTFEDFSTTRVLPISSISTSPSTITFPSSTFGDLSTTAPISSISTTTPPPTTWLSTTPFSTTPQSTSTLSSSSVTITPSSTLGLSTGRCVTAITPVPSLLLNGLKKASDISFPLKIRVTAPKGSITNVHINPYTTTQKPTTRRPSTTKKPTTRKPKKNNYDRCLDGCRKVKDPICAAPLSHRELDPKTLRGFPSVCHMACHNSYRKQPFERVIEGSCSKLRTQIRLIDSRKLRKDELRKNEYSIQDDKTVIELTGLQ